MKTPLEMQMKNNGETTMTDALDNTKLKKEKETMK